MTTIEDRELEQQCLHGRTIDDVCDECAADARLDDDDKEMLETAHAEDNESLVARYVNLERTIEMTKEELGRIEWELTKRMEADDATVLGVTGFEVSLDYKYTYDPSVLAGLRELISPEDLEGVWEPEHDEMVHMKESWNMVKGRHLGKFGKPAQEILDRARIRGRGKLKVASKEGQR